MTVLSLGGGVQSTTLALMACEGELHLDAVVFADTGAEPSFVYRHLEWLAEQLQKAKIPLHIVRNGNLLEDLQTPRKRVASMPVYVRKPDGKPVPLWRQCTEEYKLKPIRRWLRAHGATLRNPAIVALGISTDEVGRMRDSNLEYIRHWYPLIERRMNRASCVAWLEARGYPVPPKSACVCCPFHSDGYWRMLQKQYPEEFARACAIDELVRRRYPTQGACYLHKSLRPLRTISFSEQLELPLGECTRYCFSEQSETPLDECTGYCHT